MQRHILKNSIKLKYKKKGSVSRETQKVKKIMTKTTKTQRDFYNELLTNYDLTTELVDFINGRIAQLDKKAKSGKGELTETQKENLVLANEIMDYMKGKSNVTIAQIRKSFDLTAQKVTPIMKTLETENKVSKIVDKRVSYYTLV